MIDYNQKIMEKDEWWTKTWCGAYPSVKCPPEIAVGWLEQFFSNGTYSIVEVSSRKKLLPKFDFKKYFAEHPEAANRKPDTMQSTNTLTGLGEN